MAYPTRFTSLRNFELAFQRIVRGQNKEYKNFFRHLLPTYQLGLRDNLVDLIDDIKRGTFEPSQATRVFSPKASGVLRPLSLLVLRDQIVYQAMANVLAIAFKPEQDKHKYKKCYGAIFDSSTSPFFYRSWRRSYRQFDRAISKAFQLGNDFVADFDLVSFYELIDHDLLRQTLKKRLKNEDLLDLLFKCLTTWTMNTRGHCSRHGIPQGPEPSAFIAECFLFYFDSLKFKDVVYLRYVDDIKLLAKTESPARRALLKLDIESKQLGLVPQAQKIELRRVAKLSELRKNLPSSIVNLKPTVRVSASTHKRLERMFRASLTKQSGEWRISNPTRFKFSLIRLNPRKRILTRIAPLLDKRPDMSWVFSAYLRKFSSSKPAADVLLNALKRDPTYDMSAANYIDALNVCEPVDGNSSYRRVIQTAQKRSAEQSIILNIAAASFRGRRSGPKDALKLIEKETDPLVKSTLVHRLFGYAPDAPFKIIDAAPLLARETESQNADLARFCATLLLDLWPWSKANWTPTKDAHSSVKLLLKSLGYRAKGPKKKGILDKFFQEKMKIGTRITWRKALGKELRHAERRCLRVQQLEVGDPTGWVLMLDTFNELLVQEFSKRHPSLLAAFKKAAGVSSHPDLGNWLNHPALPAVLPKGIVWLRDVHSARVKADLAHAKSKKGVPTKPVTYARRDKLRKGAVTPWAELIGEWRKLL